MFQLLKPFPLPASKNFPWIWTFSSIHLTLNSFPLPDQENQRHMILLPPCLGIVGFS